MTRASTSPSPPFRPAKNSTSAPGYFGNVYNDGDEYGDYRDGIFAVSVSDGSAQYSFDTEIMLFTEDFYDSSDWALDYENALDANAMSSSDVNAWTVDLLAAR